MIFIVLDCNVGLFVLRMKKAEIPCPQAVLLKKHILVMSFIGEDHVPAPKLKDIMLSSEDMKAAYFQVLHVRKGGVPDEEHFKNPENIKTLMS